MSPSPTCVPLPSGGGRRIDSRFETTRNSHFRVGPGRRSTGTARSFAAGVPTIGSVSVAGVLNVVPSGPKSKIDPLTVELLGRLELGAEIVTVIVVSWLSAPGGMTSVAPPAVTVPPVAAITLVGKLVWVSSPPQANTATNNRPVHAMDTLRIVIS